MFSKSEFEMFVNSYSEDVVRELLGLKEEDVIDYELWIERTRNRHNDPVEKWRELVSKAIKKYGLGNTEANFYSKDEVEIYNTLIANEEIKEKYDLTDEDYDLYKNALTEQIALERGVDFSRTVSDITLEGLKNPFNMYALLYYSFDRKGFNTIEYVHVDSDDCKEWLIENGFIKEGEWEIYNRSNEPYALCDILMESYGLFLYAQYASHNEELRNRIWEEVVLQYKLNERKECSNELNLYPLYARYSEYSSMKNCISETLEDTMNRACMEDQAKDYMTVVELSSEYNKFMSIVESELGSSFTEEIAFEKGFAKATYMIDDDYKYALRLFNKAIDRRFDLGYDDSLCREATSKIRELLSEKKKELCFKDKLKEIDENDDELSDALEQCFDLEQYPFAYDPRLETVTKLIDDFENEYGEEDVLGIRVMDKDTAVSPIDLFILMNKIMERDEEGLADCSLDALEDEDECEEFADWIVAKGYYKEVPESLSKMRDWECNLNFFNEYFFYDDMLDPDRTYDKMFQLYCEYLSEHDYVRGYVAGEADRWSRLDSADKISECLVIPGVDDSDLFDEIADNGEMTQYLVTNREYNKSRDEYLSEEKTSIQEYRDFANTNFNIFTELYRKIRLTVHAELAHNYIMEKLRGYYHYNGKRPEELERLYDCITNITRHYSSNKIEWLCNAAEKKLQIAVELYNVYTNNDSDFDMKRKVMIAKYTEYCGDEEEAIRYVDSNFNFNYEDEITNGKHI